MPCSLYVGCTVNVLLCEQSALSYQPLPHKVQHLNDTMVIAGVTRGQLQKLQTDLSKWAGMAGLMCASLGWWQLEALLASLSQQAAAGVRPELLRLMDIPSMTAANARYAMDLVVGFMPVAWTQGELPCHPAILSQQVAAGIRPELLCLLEIACITAANCRYGAG